MLVYLTYYNYFYINYYSLEVVDIEKLKFIDFLIKHKKTPTVFRLAMFDEVACYDGSFTLEEIQQSMKDKGTPAHNNSIYECGKLLTWSKIIKKDVFEDPVNGLVWRFVSNINELAKSA